MKRTLVSLALGVAAAGGMTALAALPAQASTVYCDSITFSSSNGGNAKASSCDHSTSPQVRLKAECEGTPFNSYSPWQGGPFYNYNFSTASCTFGVEAAGFVH